MRFRCVNIQSLLDITKWVLRFGWKWDVKQKASKQTNKQTKKKIVFMSKCFSVMDSSCSSSGTGFSRVFVDRMIDSASRNRRFVLTKRRLRDKKKCSLKRSLQLVIPFNEPSTTIQTFSFNHLLLIYNKWSDRYYTVTMFFFVSLLLKSIGSYLVDFS